MWAKNKQSGFTIVELLIVIVVIGILAAITIVAYNGIQERARVATAQSDLANIAKKMGLYYAQYGEYPDTVAEIQAAKISTTNKGADSAIYCGNSSGYAVILNEKSDLTGRQFKIGTGISLAEVNPKLSWGGTPLCASTPYPPMLWNDFW